MYLYSYPHLEVKSLINIFLSILTFYVCYIFKNILNKKDLSVVLLILRFFIYFSFIIFLFTYSGLSDIGLDFDNIIYGSDGVPGIVRQRCSGIYCIPVFRSLLTNSNYFISLLFFSIILISKYKKVFKYNFNLKINGLIVDSLNIDKILIFLMAIVSDSRVYFCSIMVVLIFDIFKYLFFIKKSNNLSKIILISIFSILIFFSSKNSLYIITPIFKGILYIPNTILERLEPFLDFDFPFTIFGNGFGTTWAERFSFSSEYLIQTILTDFGLVGLFLFFIISLKFIFDNYIFIKVKQYSFENKFLTLLVVCTF